MDGIAHVNLK